MKRILITGGAGFIGSHLCDRLLQEGNQVIVVDNLYTGTKDNIVHNLTNPRFEFIRHDIINPLMLEVDEVYHLACPASPVHYQSNPVKTVKTNVIGTINMLGLAKRVGAKFLLASTSEIYGDPKEHPQKETYWGHVNCIGPRSCYDEGKRVAETLTFSYINQNNSVDAKIVRIFNTYGSRMLFNDGRVISNFVAQALKNEDITVYGDGCQTRSFCFVSDMVEGLIKAMNSTTNFGPWNLGNPIEMNILEVSKIIIESTNSKSKIIFKPLPVDDPIRRKPDISKANQELGWSPKVSFVEGLKVTIDNFKSRLESK